MRISSYSPQNRYRRRSSERLVLILVSIFILGAIFGLGVMAGSVFARQEDRKLAGQVGALERERNALRRDVTTARAEAQTAQKRYDLLQNSYEEILPAGPLQDLTALLKEQLDEGKSPARLADIIRSAKAPQACSEPETKRFVVNTPAYDGPMGRVELADGALVIAAEGQSAVNADGEPEAWFDPSKAVEVSFVIEDGESGAKKGVLPFEESIIVDDQEYRITIGEGAQSFAKVTYDICGLK